MKIGPSSQIPFSQLPLVMIRKDQNWGTTVGTPSVATRGRLHSDGASVYVSSNDVVFQFQIFVSPPSSWLRESAGLGSELDKCIGSSFSRSSPFPLLPGPLCMQLPVAARRPRGCASSSVSGIVPRLSAIGEGSFKSLSSPALAPRPSTPPVLFKELGHHFGEIGTQCYNGCDFFICLVFCALITNSCSFFKGGGVGEGERES